jgi:hypothetical protein
VGSLLHELLAILEVSCHLLLDVLLRVSDVDLVLHLASNLVDDDRNPVYSSILALACSSAGVSAVAVSYLEIHQLNPISELLREISCKHLPQIGKLVVGYQDVQPFEIESVSHFFQPLVDRFLPELRVANTQMFGSISLLVSFQLLLFVFVFTFIQV